MATMRPPGSQTPAGRFSCRLRQGGFSSECSASRKSSYNSRANGSVAGVAQLVEQRIRNAKVVGSNPISGTTISSRATRKSVYQGAHIKMNKAARKRILVTGGAGFVGSHLCDRLVSAGDDVVCADNFYTGDKRNIAHLLGESNFELIRHDVTFPLYLEVDQIYNLACPASPVHYQYDPVQTTKTSVHGAINMLGLAKRTGARILQASTSEVYGDPEVHPQPEGYWGKVNPVGVRSCYDEGKRCAETLFFDYWRQHRVEIKVARIFNTYGPRMHPDDGRVVSNFIVQALRAEPLTVFGDGSQTRSFCYVDDLVEGLIRLMESRTDFTGPVNLGNPGEFSMLELAAEVIQQTGSRSATEFKALPQDDPQQRRPDIDLARKELSWEPTIALAEGLGRTVEYFKTIL